MQLKLKTWLMVLSLMGRLGAMLSLIGLIGLMLSCSHVEMIDHESPVKPIDTQMAHKLKHVNGIWYK